MCFQQKQNKAWYIIKNWWSSYCRSNFIKILGVIFYDKLNWRDHVSFVCRKVARGLGVIIKARKVLQKESLISLYHSFIYPYLIYCNKMWGSSCKTHRDPLFILQKRALHIITGVHPRSLCLVNWSFWIVKISLNILLVALCIESIMVS